MDSLTSQYAKTAPSSGASRRGKVVRWIAWAALPAVVAISFLADSASTAPNIPAINLSADPLYAVSSGDKPTIALALSVEFPTVGAQYVDVAQSTTDASYANTREYLGYYDAEACYTYNNTPTETPATGMTASDYKRFDRSGAATNRMCSDAFSGNFLNWASSSAIDMLRLALSGGDRYIDTPSLTILQRAVIPNGDPRCFWNSVNFPAKQLQRNGGGSNVFWGAIPQAMRTLAGSNDVWIANTLNRIYFGLSATGGCNDTGAYTLGTVTTAGIGPVSGTLTQSLPSNASGSCASENGTCSFSGIREVWYGAGNQWRVAPASNGVSCSNSVFGDPAVGVGKACYTRPYTGSWTPGTSSNLTSDGFFYARVQVCNVASGMLQDVRDATAFKSGSNGLCTQYPSGNYKPVGAIQKYSEQLRLSAFGYLMDPTASYSNGRYGGVLRAPMKYVGAKTFNINGVENTPTGGNPNAEWDASTGVFKANPDSDTSQTPAISGVVNYLNKFGRTGPVAGRYKTYDPVGELYYETLRYLQGLSPSADAISNITTDMYDGFPVFTSWSDPYGDSRSATADYSCMKSNIVVIGDINTHDGSRFPSASSTGNIPDISYWTGVVQNFERNNAVNYVDGQGATRTTGNPNTANGNPPGSAIVGTAYWAHTHDIRGTNWTAGSGPSRQRPGMRVKTFIFDVNEYAEQNNDSVRRNNNQFFTAAKYGGFETDASNPQGEPYNTWGNPFKRQDGTNDNLVWRDPTRVGPNNTTGEASTYFLQSGARGVLNAFDEIFSRASTAARSIAGSAIQNKNLTQAGSIIYQGTFDTSDWSGDLLAVPVSVSGSNTVTVSPTTLWTASARLETLGSPATTRKIFIAHAGATANPKAANFTWAEVGSTIQGHLAKLTPASTADSLGSDRLNYLRGDQSREGSPFRRRTRLLGDIVNSGVAYSGSPTLSISANTGYNAFFEANKNRAAAVFVGANDGMLHAFNAATGDELFGFIPSWMAPKLAALTNPNYLTNHQSYVDGPPVVAEAQTGTGNTAADWKTVLVSGTGGGGQGVFALDVTNPSTFAASNVMWEFTNKDDADMGFVVGRPQILKLRTSAANAAPAYRWFALVASGVNNYTQSNGSGGTTDFSNGNPALFLLALDKPAGTAWTSTGSSPNYYKISVPIDATLSATKATGVLNFRAVLGANRELTEVFMGDLHGNLWKLNFKPYGSADWTMGNLSPFNKGTTSTPIPMFIAKDASDNIQPITMAPTVVAGALADTSYVVVGTGKYLEIGDKATTTRQSVYAVYDNGTATPDSSISTATSAISGRARLQQGTLNTSTFTISVPAFKWGRPTTDGDTTQRSGWYFDFAASGERQISNATIFGDSVIFGSLIPGASASAGTCGATTGSGNEYIVNVDTGNGSFKVSTVGIMGEPLVGEISNATTYTTSDSTGRRTRTTKSQIIQQGSTGLNATSTTTTTVIAGRLSWRQINNYRDLKNAP